LNRTQKKGARSVLAFGKNNDMYFIFTPTPVQLNYGDLSVALEKLGFLSYAISPDGSGSTLLYYKGKYIARPGRKIVSVIAVSSEIPSDNP
jgi:exopolysaccharide biosynthesis protein